MAENNINKIFSPAEYSTCYFYEYYNVVYDCMKFPYSYMIKLIFKNILLLLSKCKRGGGSLRPQKSVRKSNFQRSDKNAKYIKWFWVCFFFTGYNKHETINNKIVPRLFYTIIAKITEYYIAYYFIIFRGGGGQHV